MIEQENTKTSIRRIADHKLYYADGSRVVAGDYDFKLVFSINERDSQGSTNISECFTLILTPAHAKDLASALMSQVANYERNFMPLEFVESYKARVEEKRAAMEYLLKITREKDDDYEIGAPSFTSELDLLN